MRMRIGAPGPLTLIIIGTVAVVGCGRPGDDSFVIPDSPDGTVRVVMAGLAAHHPEVVWRALPPSYQQDVADLATSFAENMDPAIFDRAVAVASKGTAVLQSKKDLIFETEILRSSNLDLTRLDATWESVISSLDVLLMSELAQLDSWADLDVDTLLGTTGSQLMERAAGIALSEADGDTVAARLASMKDATVELERRDGDRAAVRVTTPDGRSELIAMIRVEDRWLPSELVERWPGVIDQASTRIELLGGDDAAQARAQMLFGVALVEGLIDQVATVETPEELDELIGRPFGAIVGGPRGKSVTEG